MKQVTSKTKEMVLNTVGFTLMHVDIDPDFHDKLMEKLEKRFWPVFLFILIGIISYLI